MTPAERGEGKHTPTPWKRGEASNNIIIKDSYEIQIHGGEGDEPVDEDMAFIVKACNAYDSNQATIRELVEALEEAQCVLWMAEKWAEGGSHEERQMVSVIMEKVVASIAKATKEGRG